MKVSELKSLSEQQRQDKLKEMSLELMKERAQIASGTAPKNPGRVRVLRRTIARIHTLGASTSAEKPKEQKNNG